jgi:pimeloyl-ACP methyl ester carboxylesterase
MHSLLLLHGAIGAADQMDGLAHTLRHEYSVYTPDFSGHGGKTFPDESFSMRLFAEDVLQLMDKEGLQQVSIFGYSMGGYVAMYLAKHFPERINKIITLATKFYWDETIAAKETAVLDAAAIEAKVPAFAKALEQRHGNWKELLKRTADMLTALGKDNTLKPDDYSSINTPTLVLLGDRDKMITLEETLAVYKSLPNAQLGILPDTSHPFEKVDTEQLVFFIKRFLN